MSILFSLATMFKLKTNTISEQTTFTTERFDTPTVSSHQGYLNFKTLQRGSLYAQNV
jgi:hypothetical protein